MTERIDDAVLHQAHSVAGQLVTVARHMFRSDDRLAAELPVAQLRMCGILQDGPRTMSVLARELGVTLSAMTQIANRLERARLVKRVAKGPDRRVKCLQLTGRGERLMRQREEARVDRVLLAIENLPLEVRSSTVASLERLAEAFVATAGEGRLAEKAG